MLDLHDVEGSFIVIGKAYTETRNVVHFQAGDIELVPGVISWRRFAPLAREVRDIVADNHNTFFAEIFAKFRQCCFGFFDSSSFLNGLGGIFTHCFGRVMHDHVLH